MSEAVHQIQIIRLDKKGLGMEQKRGPSQEYLLQGSVIDDSVDILLHRLRGMCDNSEEDLLKFREHEIVYSMREGPSVTSNSVSVRVRKQLNSPDQPWTLCYLGNPEIGDRTRPTTVRTCVEVNCTQNACSFLQELGFGVEYEFVSQGWLFRRNRLKVIVAKVCRMSSSGNTEQVVPLSKSHLVEVSIISDSGNDQAANEVHSISEQLKPLVNLDKIDPRRLGSAIQESLEKFSLNQLSAGSLTESAQIFDYYVKDTSIQSNFNRTSGESFG